MDTLEEKPDLTLKDAAKILNVTYLGLYVLAKNGKVPAYRLGSKWRISRNELEKFRRGEYNSSSQKQQKVILCPSKNVENIIPLDFASKVKRYEEALEQALKRKR